MRSLIHQRKCAYMKKFLLGFVCGLIVVGVANMGHAFQLFGGGGGGGHRKSSAGLNLDVGSLSNFDFHQFGLDPKRGDPDPIHPDLGLNRDNSGPNLQFESDFNLSGNGGSGDIAQNAALVPEPATMILLGIALIGVAGYGNAKFKKQP